MYLNRTLRFNSALIRIGYLQFVSNLGLYALLGCPWLFPTIVALALFFRFFNQSEIKFFIRFLITVTSIVMNTPTPFTLLFLFFLSPPQVRHVEVMQP